MKKTWLEVALNGSWGKARQPRSPVRIAEIVAEGIACANEGAAIDAYLRLLGREASAAPWMVAGLAVDLLPLAGHAVANGGHLRVGLEDAPFGSQCSNVEWVCAGHDAIERARGSLASATEVRAALSRPR